LVQAVVRPTRGWKTLPYIRHMAIRQNRRCS
jgi:hypothetical protein